MRGVLDYIRKAAIPYVGRMTPAQLRYMGENLNPPAVLIWGPFIVLMDIPRRFWKADQEPSIEEFNAAVKALMADFVADLNRPHD